MVKANLAVPPKPAASSPPADARNDRKGRSLVVAVVAIGLLWRILLGVLLSEGLATLVVGQIQILCSSLAEATRAPALPGSLGSEGPVVRSSIVEVQDLASRLQHQRKKVAPLSQDFTDVSDRLKPCSERQRILSTIDPLTGTNNRSDLDHVRKLVSQRADACSVPLS